MNITHSLRAQREIFRGFRERKRTKKYDSDRGEETRRGWLRALKGFKEANVLWMQFLCGGRASEDK